MESIESKSPEPYQSPTQNDNDKVPSLLQQSLNVCLDYWRQYFVNPSASCRMKWPGAFVIFEVIKRLQDKLSIRDISGMCITMLDADDNLSAQNWLNIIFNIHESFSSSKEYFLLVEQLCDKIPETESKTLEDWITHFGLSFQPTLSWVFALRRRLKTSPTLTATLSPYLNSDVLDKRTVELVCIFKMETLVESLKDKLENEAETWEKSNSNTKQKYMQENFEK